MGLRNNATCMVFLNNKDGSPKEWLHEKYADIMCGISYRKADGSYVHDFMNTVRFLGQAFEVVKTLNLQDRDVLRLISVEVVQWKSQSGQWYTKFICWECQKGFIGKEEPKVPVQPKVVDEIEPYKARPLQPIEDDDLPF